MKSNKIKFFIDSIKLKLKLNNKRIFFFFPFYHIGGAERVHVDILKVFKNNQIVCIITSKSSNNYFYDEFKANSQIIEIEKLNPKYSPKHINHIINHINKTENSIVFGCNSGMFYNSIKLFDSHVKIIDLIHAFSYEEENSAEKYSLPFVERIDKRVVLGGKTYADFKSLYLENKIDLKNLEKIKVIKNKVDVPDNFPLKPNNKNLKVLFVGRNSYEKRPNIFFKIAQKCLDTNLPVEFKVIGDFEKDLKVPDNVLIEGLIIDKNTLNTFYLNSDILLITSSREGFPMVILESMAYGVISINTNVGEISEFINENNENGYLIDNNSNEELIVDDFVKKINLLINNNTLLKETQLKAFLTIANNYKTEVFNQEYKNLFFN